VRRMVSRAQKAAELFDSGFNCCQAVLGAFCGEFGLDEETALKIACGFGSGVARRQEICGAVSGAIMVAGLRHGRARLDDREAVEKTYSAAQSIVSEFIERHGSVACRELLGCDISTAESRRRAEADGLYAKCALYVKDAALLAARGKGN
jgi:C_GCAxxG_C_C family probable redox protein